MCSTKALSGNFGRAGATLEDAATDYASTITRQGEAIVGSLTTTAYASQSLVQLLTKLEATTTGLSGEIATVNGRIGSLPQTVAEAAVAIDEVRGAGGEHVQTLVNEVAATVSSRVAAAVTSRACDGNHDRIKFSFSKDEHRRRRPPADAPERPFSGFQYKRKLAGISTGTL